MNLSIKEAWQKENYYPEAFKIGTAKSHTQGALEEIALENNSS